MRSSLLGVVSVFLWVAPVAADDLGYVEDFALAKDRAAVLRQLIPGTEDYYYYHCLQLLNTEQFDKLDEFTRPWRERFGQSARLIEIQTRYALLTYERNPERSLGYLRQHLNLRFDHQRVISGAAPDLRTSLDPKLISRETLQSYSLKHWQNLDNFEENALDWLAASSLDWQRRRFLLQRLIRPDLPNLPALIVEDLQSPHAGAFGGYPVERQLTITQLEELLRLRPELLNQTAFVQIWLRKLQPDADADWRHDAALTRAYLDRLQSFVERLSTAHNSLKAHILYQRLVFDRAQGVYDHDRFLAYLALPRHQGYVSQGLLESDEGRRFPVDLNADFTESTLLPIIRGDEELVRDYLKHFLFGADSAKEFEPFINDVYLRRIFAEVKIENGLGDEEQWAALLPQDLFRQFKERIDIDFAATNKTDFAAEEPVKLDLFVKNVPALLVKIFEINTLHYYRSQGREVDTDINLDGLVANAEQSHAYTDSPLRRVARRFEFPELNKPGVYVVDFIGAGKSSRALIRKGKLRPLITSGSAGQVVRIFDEANHLVKDGAVWFGGAEYTADAEGRVIVPFSTAAGRKPLILHRGDFACLDFFEHEAEEYQLKAGIHIDRESLLSQRLATVLVRPGLYLNGRPIPVKILEDVKLRLLATDDAGIPTATDVPNFKLFEDRESTYEFRVPARLNLLTVMLEAKIKSLTQHKSIDLSAIETLSINQIDKTERIEDLHLAKFGDDYVIELRGLTGESKPNRPVQIALKHRDFREPVQTTLKTDERGRILLGPLPEIVNVTATGPEGTAESWNCPDNRCTYRQVMHAKAGTTVNIPYLGSAVAPSRDEVALFELRGGLIREDRFEALKIHDGMLELHDLRPGDYDLVLKRVGEKIRIRVVDGEVQGRYVLGKLRALELPALAPLQIAAITADAEQLTVRVRDFSLLSRVHIFATRYAPAFSAFNDFSTVRAPELSGSYPAHSESVYLTGRNIGDEYRYVLDRRGMKKYPGNMLERPQLLLNPWVLRSTETVEQQAEAGAAFGGRGTPPASAAMPTPPAASEPMKEVAKSDFANLDFLADAAAVLINLVPDEHGVIKVPRKLLTPHAMIHVMAVDPGNTVYRSTALPEQPAQFLDLRLANGLDPKRHFTQQKQITILEKGKPFVLANAAESRFESYDSLAKTYALYSTLSKDPKLAEFAFILDWPKLKAEEKQALYSKFACHELNFFLLKKDPPFFKEVVLPFLANKKDKTFLDRWLLTEDLTGYLQPWPYSRLNAVEQVLLAQRINGEGQRTARALDDTLRLQPPNIDQLLNLFDTAIKSGALDALSSANVIADSPSLGVPRMAGRVSIFKQAEAKGRQGGLNPAPAGQAGGFGLKAGGTKKSEMNLRSRNGAEREGAILDKADGLIGSLAKDEDAQRDRTEALGRQLFLRVEPTMEWAEDNYYHLPIQQQLAELVPPSAFWLDYAKYDGKGPFLSRHFAEAARNFTESMFALAVLDLPFEFPKNEVVFKDGQMTLTPAGPAITFHEEVRSATPAPGHTPILVSQKFFRQGDRYRQENGEKVDKFVTEEFIVQTVYGCQVVVTNPTSARQKLSVLVQLPVGALPVNNGQFTKSVMLDLEPYRTSTFDYFFYFPLPGTFAQFPMQVAKNENLVAAAEPATFHVVEKPSKLDTGSWDYVSQNGTNDEVLEFLRRENVLSINVEKIAFRMKDRAFAETVLNLLSERHFYNGALWSYALLHNIPAAAQQYLLHSDQIVNECGGPIKTPLLILDPVARHLYEHLEYRPIVNARAHALGKRRQIVNGPLNEQYHRFLKLLTYHRELGTVDRRVADVEALEATYYLLLQDRVDLALELFGQVNASLLPNRLQYDYCEAYLSFYGDTPQQARAIAANYINYPIERWRNAFRNIIAQLDEMEGKNAVIVEADDRSQRQGHLAANEAGFDFTLEGKQIQLGWQNLNEVRINYYLMDVELLFSRNPFVRGASDSFASIRPNTTQVVKLSAGQNKLAIPLPPELTSRNVLVEISAAGKSTSHPYYANAMDVRLLENYGQIHAVDAASSKALPKIYVKVYAHLANGAVKFHKDGYTDYRGRFDYASVSTPETTPIDRFAILVLSDEHGTLIREATPPAR